MKTKTSLIGLLIFSIIVLAISPAIATAHAAPTHYSEKVAVAEWTVTAADGKTVTMSAVLIIPPNGPSELTVTVTHPNLGTWTTTATNLDCKWSMNHASADASMAFGPKLKLHSISIQWTATSSPIVAHYRGIDPTIGEYAVINQPITNADAKITIDDGTPLHPGTYPSDFAAIANIIENVK